MQLIFNLDAIKMQIRCELGRVNIVLNTFSIWGGWIGGATAYLGGCHCLSWRLPLLIWEVATAYLVGGWEDESKNKTNLSQSWS